MEKTVPTGGAADAWDREVSEGNGVREHAALALSGRATGLSAERGGERATRLGRARWGEGGKSGLGR